MSVYKVLCSLASESLIPNFEDQARKDERWSRRVSFAGFEPVE